LPSCKLITTSLHGKRWCLERAEFSDFHSTSRSNKEIALANPLYFQVVVTGLLESCQNYVVSKQSNLTHWHPVLGWFAQPMGSIIERRNAPRKNSTQSLVELSNCPNFVGKRPPTTRPKHRFTSADFEPTK
jgi:hypothetical protein